ncbi:MAG: sensor histidine kinase [Solirubrobacteraceae bacterium]
MIRRSGLRSRLAVWVVGVLIAVCAVVFVVVYEVAGSQLRSQVSQDVRDDLGQLVQTVRALHTQQPQRLLTQLHAYVRAQPYQPVSSLLFAVIPGRGTVSNHPEVLAAVSPERDENVRTERRESALVHALLAGPTGQRNAYVPDVGDVRLDEQVVNAAGVRVRLGAGEPLLAVVSAQRSIARAFLLAGLLALMLVLVASYLAGVSVSRPLRRMARAAALVHDGDLQPRMAVSPSAAREIRVLAQAFNSMLDRLAVAFAHQREFVADASHELRTPLTVIAGQLELLATQPRPAPAEIRRIERLVSAEVNRSSRLIDDMLLLTRAEHRDFLRRRPFRLRGFIADLWTTTIVRHRRVFELGDVPDVILNADPDRLAQALRNLLENALAHTKAPSGRVGLHVDARPGGGVRFTVTDDGPGISQDQRERIFERFYRTDAARDRAAGGAGLGLAIVQAIAHAHGGRAQAVDPDLGGARLQLEIPGARVRLDGKSGFSRFS